MTVAPPESPNAGPSQEELLDAMLLHAAHSGPPSPVHKTVRSSFIPRSDSPGPAAYNPNEALVKVSPGTTVFGTCTRDKENTRSVACIRHALHLYVRVLWATNGPASGSIKRLCSCGKQPQSHTYLWPEHDEPVALLSAGTSAPCTAQARQHWATQDPARTGV